VHGLVFLKASRSFGLLDIIGTGIQCDRLRITIFIRFQNCD